MRAVNHTVTGAVIGAALGNPVLALPTALLSHLVLDAIPHSGDENMAHTSLRFKIELLIDAALSAAFLLAVILLQPTDWPLLIACGVLGAAPDFWWFPYWIGELMGKKPHYDPVGRFLKWIQWSEKPWGYYLEAVWLAGALYLFFRLTS
ncbi:MAG TPA: hypothetical protein VK674_00905 [Candidatus Limnocylindria bacterium]|nr:hypothetical protein [Candidatus Limnocylindria bacterium]